MSPFYKRVSIETLMSSNSMAQLPSTQSPPKPVRIYSRIFFLLTNFLIIYMQLIFSCYCWDQMSFLSDVKLVAQILGLVILIITLILTLCRLLTNNTVTNAQIRVGSLWFIFTLQVLCWLSVFGVRFILLVKIECFAFHISFSGCFSLSWLLLDTHSSIPSDFRRK